MSDAARRVDEIIFFLRQFTGDHTYQTFDDQPDKNSKLSRILHDPAELDALNRRGAGVFLTINEANGRGRKIADITRVRSYFADFDGAALPHGWPLDPCLLVETSPGKYHAYWILQPDEVVPLDNTAYNRQQEAIARAVGSQPDDCKGLNRPMRMPGFWHQKGTPFLSRVVKSTDERFTLQQVQAAYPVPASMPLIRSPRNMRPFAASSTPRRRKYALKVLYTLADELSIATEGERNNRLNFVSFRAGRLVGGGHLERDEVEVELTQAGQKAGLSVKEIEGTLQRALTAGMADPDPLEFVGLSRASTTHHAVSPSGVSDGETSAPPHQTLKNGVVVQETAVKHALSKYLAKLHKKLKGRR